jgi:hypothetical protein
MSKFRGPTAALILLTAALACVVPGMESASTIPPTPDTRLGTMVAETVSAALAETALAASPETPSPTPSPEPTAVPAAQYELPGSALETQEDGSTLFVDENAGYQITVPAGWLAVRVNEKEFYDAFLLPEVADERMQSALQGIQEQDPASFRLFVLDTMEGHVQNEIVTNVNLIWDPRAAFSFESEDDLQDIASQLPLQVDGLSVISAQVVVPPSGIVYGEIESEIGGLNALGQQVVLYQKIAIFNLKAGALIVTFTTESGFTDATLPLFEGMLETVLIETE